MLQSLQLGIVRSDILTKRKFIICGHFTDEMDVQSSNHSWLFRLCFIVFLLCCSLFFLYLYGDIYQLGIKENLKMLFWNLILIYTIYSTYTVCFSCYGILYGSEHSQKKDEWKDDVCDLFWIFWSFGVLYSKSFSWDSETFIWTIQHFTFRLLPLRKHLRKPQKSSVWWIM